MQWIFATCLSYLVTARLMQVVLWHRESQLDDNGEARGATFSPFLSFSPLHWRDTARRKEGNKRIHWHWKHYITQDAPVAPVSVRVNKKTRGSFLFACFSSHLNYPSFLKLNVTLFHLSGFFFFTCLNLNWHLTFFFSLSLSSRLQCKVCQVSLTIERSNWHGSIYIHKSHRHSKSSTVRWVTNLPRQSRHLKWK